MAAEEPEYVYRVMAAGSVYKRSVSKNSAIQTVSAGYRYTRKWNPQTRRYDKAVPDGRFRILRAPVGEWEDVTDELRK